MAADFQPAFALWLTGLPASGKSTIARALRGQLAARGIGVAVLESDALRPILAPNAGYTPPERDQFYRQLAGLGTLLTRNGVPVIFDATANRRAHRDQARAQIPQFAEVHVATPLATCIERDPKGIYRQSSQGAASTVPGVQDAYEPPAHPDLVIDAAHEAAEESARRIVALLEQRGYVPPAQRATTT